MIKEIGAEELEGLVQSGATLIDVRMPDEFEARRVRGAVLVPLPSLPERFGEIPSDETVYIICQSGVRSLKACEFLASKGYDTRNVAGGTAAWAESGRATDSGALQD